MPTYQAAETYCSKVVKPLDFDEFWRGVDDQLDSIPLNAEVVRDPMRSSDDVDVYDVHYDSLDNVRIAGWYGVPKGVSGYLPGMLLVPGYQGEPPLPKDWARLGYAALSVAPRGKLRSDSQYNPGYPGLLTHNITDRNTYGYKGFYSDAFRGLDFLLSRDEVDSERIGVTGSSQGGALTIVVAALRSEHIKAAAAGAPYLCGFVDSIELTSTYPYQEINDYIRHHPESRDDVIDTLAYFDGVCFADKITCPIIVNIGLQDNIVPTETGFMVYNAMTSTDNKRLYTYDDQGHEAGRYLHAKIVQDFFAEQLSPGTP